MNLKEITPVSVYPVDHFTHAVFLRYLCKVFTLVRLKTIQRKNITKRFTRRGVNICLSKTIYPLQSLALFGKYFKQGVAQMLDIPYSVIPCKDFDIHSFFVGDSFAGATLGKLILPEINKDRGVVIVSSNNQVVDAYLVVKYAEVAQWVALSMNGDFGIVIFSVDSTHPIGKLINLTYH